MRARTNEERQGERGHLVGGAQQQGVRLGEVLHGVVLAAGVLAGDAQAAVHQVRGGAQEPLGLLAAGERVGVVSTAHSHSHTDTVIQTVTVTQTQLHTRRA